MIKVWEKYLDCVVPLNEITQLLIYTDQHREWLANPLADLGMKLGWKVQLAFTDDFEFDDFDDIIQSFPILLSNTLIISIFSLNNPNLLELGNIFTYYKALSNYKGYSIICSHNLPDAYFFNFLTNDVFKSMDLKEKKIEKYRKGSWIRALSPEGTDLSFKITSDFRSPNFYYNNENKNISFPGTELKAMIEPKSVKGKIVVYGSISPFFDREGELLDYFGKVSNKHKFEINIENGNITSAIDESNILSTRFNRILKENDLKISHCILGFGHDDYEPPGIVFVDKNMQGTFLIALTEPLLSLIIYNITLTEN